MSHLMLHQNVKKKPYGLYGLFSYSGDSELDVQNGHVRLLDSGVLIAKEDFVCDVFLVGGGGAGSKAGSSGGARGGSGGFTLTQKGVLLEAGKSYEIIVGAGGEFMTADTVPSTASSGGTTSAFGFEAAGGTGGQFFPASSAGGGSGAGGAGIGEDGIPGDGGSDGGDGMPGTVAGSLSTGHRGQGTSTRAFGEPDGALYSGGGAGTSANFIARAGAGGGGGAVYADNGLSATIEEDGAPNTGGGGCGFFEDRSGAGGSGIVIIRKAVS